MKPSLEEVAVVPRCDEAKCLDAHTTRMTGELTHEVTGRVVRSRFFTDLRERKRERREGGREEGERREGS